MKFTGRIAGLVLVLSIVFLSALASGCNSSPSKPDSPVKLGIDNIDNYLPLFAGKKVGLVTNATGINSNFESSIDVLRAKTNLVALFSPEHGIRGAVTAGDKVNSQTDKKTGLPIYSLYGQTKKPTPEMLKNVDIMVFDIQDIGARSYTYIYTMAYAMQAAKENGKKFVVLDRPNPVGGVAVEGGIIKNGYESFIGMYPIPVRHGMTVGELAKYFNTEFGIGCDLTVVEMTGWKRDMYFDETGLPWVMTSPNIPTPDSALVYPATGIFGGTNVSEGVGTTRPFDFVAAPWLDAELLADKLNAQKLPGVYFRPAYYIPRFGNFTGQNCAGVQLHVIDRKSFQPVKTGLVLLYTVREMGQDKFSFQFNGKKPEIDLITGDNKVRLGIELQELLAEGEKEAQEFKQRAKKYYLYP